MIFNLFYSKNNYWNDYWLYIGRVVMKRSLLIFVFQCVSAVSFFTQESFESIVSNFFSIEEINNPCVGIELRNENGEILLMHHSKKLFVPASLQNYLHLLLQ